MADIITEVTSNPLFLVAIGILAGSVFVFMWLSKRQKEAPEAKFGYGKKIWNELVLSKIKDTMKQHGIKTRPKKNFIVGNERYGQIVKYMNVLMTPSKQLGYRIEAPGVVSDELRELRAKIIDLETDRKYGSRKEDRETDGSGNQPNDTSSKA